MASEPTDIGLLAQIFMWVTGGVVGTYGAVIAFLFGRVTSVQRQVDQAPVFAERRYALKSDMAEMRRHVDTRFDAMESNQEANRQQIIAEIRAAGGIGRRH